MSDYIDIDDLANKVIAECRKMTPPDLSEVEGLVVELLDQRKRNRRQERQIEELKRSLNDSRTEIAVRLMAGMLARGKTDAKYALQKADELLAEVAK